MVISIAFFPEIRKTELSKYNKKKIKDMPILNNHMIVILIAMKHSLTSLSYIKVIKKFF